MKLILGSLQSPLGGMLLACDEQGRVRALEFAQRRSRLHRNLREQYGNCEFTDGAVPGDVTAALRLYFEGDLGAIDTIAVETAGTGLQEKVWAQLRRIPAGRTSTYADIGRAAGITDWRAAVDAGAAVGANPVAIVVPCHRVLGAGGDLKGYAWGLHRKRWLLEHEAAIGAEIAAPQTVSLF